LIYHANHYFTTERIDYALIDKTSKKEKEFLTDEEIINQLLRKITLQIESETRNEGQKRTKIKEPIQRKNHF